MSGLFNYLFVAVWGVLSVAPSGLIYNVYPLQGFRASHFTPACVLASPSGFIMGIAVIRGSVLCTSPLPVVCCPVGAYGGFIIYRGSIMPSALLSLPFREPMEQ